MGSCISGEVRATSNQSDTLAMWKANYSSSVRSSLLQKKKYSVEEDFTIHSMKHLGKGGCGEVYSAERIDNGQIYAIKFCDKSKVDQTRLEREILLLKDTDHCNIVRLFSAYETATFTYLVMEICYGGHLGKLLVSRSSFNLNKMPCIDEEWAKSLCRQLLSAVSHMHERGIAHRDIKLQNILLESAQAGRNVQLKVIDFGYASRFIGCCPMRTVCGTPYTTAPEVFRESYDERCDVWSVGVVLFVMLSGKRPFEALDIKGSLTDAGKTAMITNILAGRYSFNPRYWSHVSEEGKDFLAQLLHPKYWLRMQAKDALNAPWIKTRSDLMPDLVHASVNRLNCADRLDDHMGSGSDWHLGWLRASHKSGSEHPHATATIPTPLSSQQTALTPQDLEDMIKKQDSSKHLVDAIGGSDNKAVIAASLGIISTGPKDEKISQVINNIVFNHSSSNWNLGEFSFRRTGSVALAYDMHQSQIRDVRKLFQSVDIDGSGALSKSEFTEAMLILCGPDKLTVEDCSLIFSRMDVNCDDQITFTEFLAASLNPQELDIDELSRAFSLLDCNGDGYISAEELAKLYNFKHMKKNRVQESEDVDYSSNSPKARIAYTPDQHRATVDIELEKEKSPPILQQTHSSGVPLSGDAVSKPLKDALKRETSVLQERVMRMMSACDTDHDGQISYEEFIFAMTGASDLLAWTHNAINRADSLLVEQQAAVEPVEACSPDSLEKSASVINKKPDEDSHQSQSSMSSILKSSMKNALSAVLRSGNSRQVSPSPFNAIAAVNADAPARDEFSSLMNGSGSNSPEIGDVLVKERQNSSNLLVISSA